MKIKSWKTTIHNTLAYILVAIFTGYLFGFHELPMKYWPELFLYLIVAFLMLMGLGWAYKRFEESEKEERKMYHRYEQMNRWNEPEKKRDEPKAGTKFLELTDRGSGKRIAVNVDKIAYIADTFGTEIFFIGDETSVYVLENYNTVIKKLNEIKG